MFRVLITLSVALLLVIIIFAETGKSDVVFPGKYWEVVSPENQGVDSAKLDSAMKYLASQCGKDGTKEVVIIRNGYLIWKGSEFDKKHNIWSCTKVFTSTVLGLLIDDGKCTIDSLAKDFVPSLASKYPEVTLGHFAAMTAGYRAGRGKSGKDSDDSIAPFKPGPIPLFAPGTAYAYWNDAANMLGYILTRIAQEPMYKLFKRRIADPIGMNPKKWEWRNWGTVGRLIVNGGAGNRKHGVYISAKELARFGHLLLNRGNWNGKQLISAEWIDKATQNQVPTSIKAVTPVDGRGVYGYNWWVNGVDADGNRLLPDAPLGTFFRTGYPHNMLFVVPEWNMVIVRLGIDKSPPGRNRTWNNVLKMIGEAITDKQPQLHPN